MPNWCRNYLKLKNENDLVKIVNAEGEVDYNILLPMPEDLDVTSGGLNDRDIYIYLSKGCTIEITDNVPAIIFLKRDSFTASFITKERIESFENSYTEMSEDDKKKSYEDGQKLVENFMRYGAVTWYEWCCANWGVKWNASDTDINKKGKEVEIFFCSPWGPPSGWLQKLSKEGVEFTLDWSEEGGFYGTITGDGKGNAIDSNNGNYFADDMEEGGEDNA